MTMYAKRLALLVAASMFTCGVAWAQDHTHHTHGAPAAADPTKCARAQPGIEKIISAATARADAARQSNNPAELRAAIDHLAAALRDIRAQSAPCVAAKDPDAGHTAAPSAAKQMDPVNGLMVDPATAPSTPYEGQTYYFSSEQSRKEFLENPAKFTKKPKG